MILFFGVFFFPPISTKVDRQLKIVLFNMHSIILSQILYLKKQGNNQHDFFSLFKF